MNVLIYGAANAIAIGIARLVHATGHTAVLVDSDRYSRGFYSRYGRKKCLVRAPSADGPGFAADVAACIDVMAIGLIVPTTDDALLDLLENRVAIPAKVLTTFPRDVVKVRHVLDKANLPEICGNAGVKTPATVRVDADLPVGSIAALREPLAVKRRSGVGGEGFVKVERRDLLGAALKRVRREFPGDGLLVQEFVSGPVYGAGGLFDGEDFRHFYCYETVRRYPRTSGPATVCCRRENDAVRTAMVKVLNALDWNGYCQMDFILDGKSGQPFLTDINPVHWYSMPFSSAKVLHTVARYLDSGEPFLPQQVSREAYTTIGLVRELQRIAACGIVGNQDSAAPQDYWGCCRHVRKADFYWDPLPVLLAPVLKFLRAAASRR